MAWFDGSLLGRLFHVTSTVRVALVAAADQTLRRSAGLEDRSDLTSGVGQRLMRMWSRSLSSIMIALSLFSTTARGQSGGDNRSGLTVAFGVVDIPTATGGYCTFNDRGMEGSGGLIVRPYKLWVVESDVHVATFGERVCLLNAGPTVSVDTAYYPIERVHHPFMTSTLRIGVETPARFPLFRVAAGGGVFLNGRSTPFGVVDGAWSTRGKHVRLVVAAERTWTHVAALERTFDFNNHAILATRPTKVSIVTNTVRVGFEIPLGG